MLGVRLLLATTTGKPVVRRAANGVGVDDLPLSVVPPAALEAALRQVQPVPASALEP